MKLHPAQSAPLQFAIAALVGGAAAWMIFTAVLAVMIEFFNLPYPF